MIVEVGCEGSGVWWQMARSNHGGLRVFRGGCKDEWLGETV